MNSVLIDSLRGISSASAEKYLLLTGWEKDITVSNPKIWVFYKDADPNFRIAIPSSESNPDFYPRLMDVIETLSDIQNLKITDIISSMKTAYADRIQFRFISDSSNKGKLPLSAASQIVEGLKDLVLYAACAVENAQPVCNKTFNSAKNSLDRFQFGQTEYGSFIFNVDVQIASEENEQMYLLDVAPTIPEPKEHKVVQRIRTAFDQVDRVVSKQVRLDDIIGTAYEDGMTANICDAILMLRPEALNDAVLETTFRYAEALTHSTEEVSKCKFESEHFMYAEEIAKRYRNRQEVEDVDIQGSIVMLSKDSNATETEPENTIHMKSKFESTSRNITLHLSPEDHKMACDAYRDSREVHVVGTLDKSGRNWFFEEIRTFEVLE